MLKILDRIFHKGKVDNVSFQQKFSHFQALLTANDEAHKAMSNMAEMLVWGKPFSRSYALGQYDYLMEHSEKIINHLIQMTDGSYTSMLNKLSEIKEICHKILAPRLYCEKGWICTDLDCSICEEARKIPWDIPYSYDISEIDDRLSLEVGSKMSRLGEIRNKLGIPVPDGFSLTVRLFEEIMLSEEIRDLRLEIRDGIQNTEYRIQESEVRSQKSEVRSQKSEDTRHKTQDTRQESEDRIHNSEFRIQNDGDKIEDTLSKISNLRGKKDVIFSHLDFDDINQIEKASRDTQELFASFNIPENIENIILSAFDKTFGDGEKVKVAVRSSAIGEDSVNYSFAGLHRTELNVSKQNLVDACIEVLISKYSPQSVVYRYISGLRDEDMPMSIACIKMIDAVSAGVLFTSDPEMKRDGMIIQAVHGLGSMVVEGKATPQEFRIDKSEEANILNFKPGLQRNKNTIRDSDGVKKEKIDGEVLNSPCLSKEQLKLLSKYARTIEEHYDCPQDIEWAIDQEGKVFILQARPLKVHSKTLKNETQGIESALQNENSLSIEELDSKYQPLITEGDCASHGIAFGKVFIINNLKELKNFPNGAIIVARKNLPEFASLIHKASGIITDIGSTTGHLSIIAREIGVPVLTNTVDGSKILTNGMEITLYADENRVYPGKIDELVYFNNAKNDSEQIFLKSPLYRIWHRLIKYIIKLNLLNPNAEYFRASNCQTLHDVIRFTHQMAMNIMFSLYESDNVDSGKTYSLQINIPLDICLIDLGNGIKSEVIGNAKKKLISPDDIASKPFLALIKGMTTPGIKWSGHLPMDTKGYASLIFGNIVDFNRSDTAMGSRSYALISENYMNFFSRLGYHFSRLDAYADDEINNNYINFNFRGGAADYTRKTRRAIAIQKILEYYNFSAFRTDDNVIANIRRVNRNQIYYLVSEIGRLMGAVRNTDVLMYNESIVNEFIKAFLEGDPAPALRIMI